MRSESQWRFFRVLVKMENIKKHKTKSRNKAENKRAAILSNDVGEKQEMWIWENKLPDIF